jgi:hypothetical protein
MAKVQDSPEVRRRRELYAEHCRRAAGPQRAIQRTQPPRARYREGNARVAGIAPRPQLFRSGVEGGQLLDQGRKRRPGQLRRPEVEGGALSLRCRADPPGRPSRPRSRSRRGSHRPRYTGSPGDETEMRSGRSGSPDWAAGRGRPARYRVRRRSPGAAIPRSDSDPTTHRPAHPARLPRERCEGSGL